VSSDELRQLREKLRLTQQEMANALNVSFVTYSRWENGHREVPAETGKLLDAVGVLIAPEMQKKTNLTVSDVGEALRKIGVQGVVSHACVKRILPTSLVASLAFGIPALGWVAGAIGLAGFAALAFFDKSRFSGKEDAERVQAKGDADEPSVK